MLPHLAEEEEIGLPLFRAYYAPHEADAIEQKIIAQAPTHSLGGFVYHDGTDRFRREFMKDHGIPFFVWYLVFRKHYKEYVNDVVKNVEALKTGKPPLERRRFWRILG